MSNNNSDYDWEDVDDSEYEDCELVSGGDSPDSVSKRAHKNAKIRHERDLLSESFRNLRGCIPSLADGKCSRNEVLVEAAEIIGRYKRRFELHRQDLGLLIRQKAVLDQQLKEIKDAEAANGGEAQDGNSPEEDVNNREEQVVYGGEEEVDEGKAEEFEFGEEEFEFGEEEFEFGEEEMDEGKAEAVECGEEEEEVDEDDPAQSKGKKFRL